jgi:hypothetical protein
MLKGCDDFYFLFYRIKLFVKLKKDHIVSFGDTANFAIINERRDARDKQELKIGKLW